MKTIILMLMVLGSIVFAQTGFSGGFYYDKPYYIADATVAGRQYTDKKTNTVKTYPANGMRRGVWTKRVFSSSTKVRTWDRICWEYYWTMPNEPVYSLKWEIFYK